MTNATHWVTRALAVVGVSLLLMASGIAPIAYNLIENSGTPLTKRSTLNFTGSGVSCADSGGITVCTISGGGGSGGGSSAAISSTFSPTAGSTTTLTHNFGNANHYTFCADSSGNIFTQTEITLGSNSDSIFAAAAQTSITCTAVNPGSGGITLSISTKTGAYIATSSDYTLLGDTTSGSFSIKLEASPATGQIHNVKKIVAPNTLTIDGNGNTIDGQSTIVVTTNNQNYQMQFDGAEWRVI